MLNKKIKPIIKWTGGKYKEFGSFSQYIPSFARYIEPFFGGGGVFFALQPAVPALLNDKSTDLIRFYSLIKSSEFKAELLLYADAWESAGRLSFAIAPQLSFYFQKFIHLDLSKDKFDTIVYKAVSMVDHNSYHPLFDPNFIIKVDDFIRSISVSIIDKCKRIKDISIKEKKSFSLNELDVHIETSIKSGLYLYLRSIMNKANSGLHKVSEVKAAATWYFIRELCYASMFRYNARNEFNIPYGGIAYNKKDFRQKVENIFSEDVVSLFEKAAFFNLDFEEFFKKAQPVAGDFIFLDPPYDSDFSEYDQNAFTKDDQLRLQKALINLKAKWMLVIKETDFIRALYNCDACRIIEFDKTYTYNVRGRNNRETKHLIITNY